MLCTERNRVEKEAMCKAMEEMRNETELRKAREIALTLIQLGDYSFEKIADITKLSLAEVNQLSEGRTA